MAAFPVREATPVEQATLIDRVDAILVSERAPVVELEAQIERPVLRIYGLTPEEIALVQCARS
jgi:hypothetical protein